MRETTSIPIFLARNTDPTVLIIFAIVAAAAGVGGLLVANARRKRMIAVMEDVARRLGGQFSVLGGSFFHTKTWQVEALLGGHAVILTMYLQRQGKHSHWYTRATAGVSTRHSFSIYKASIFSGIGAMLGMQDATIGDPSYDDRFVIKTDDPTWLRTILAPPVRMEHLKNEAVSLRLESGMLTATRRGGAEDAEVCIAMMQLCAACAAAASQ